MSVHLLTICYDLFTLCFGFFFFKVVEICGQRMEEFIKPFPNKEIISDKIQLALKRWQHLLFFHSLIGKFHIISALSDTWERWAPEAAESIMPTCGMSRQGLLAGARTQKHKKVWAGREGGQERKIEREIDKGREGWNTHGPSGTVLYFKPGCERIEGLEVNQSLR